ncbi:nuclear factor 1 A-type isoform X2 [Tachysurus ichikawai]
MKLADSVMAAKTSEGSIKWQLCYDISARTWWMGVVMHRNDPLWLALGPELDTGSAGMQAYEQESLISIFMLQLL